MQVGNGGAPRDGYDCFVVGSGPAGVSLALALADARKRVLIFGSGDEQTVRSELANTIGYGHYSGAYWNAHWIHRWMLTPADKPRLELTSPPAVQSP